MIILVDQDDVLTDFRTAIEKEITKRGIDIIPKNQLKVFAYEDNYPPELRDEIKSIFYQPGFHMDLPIIPGAKEALEQMTLTGHEVRICTSPLSVYENCILEKYQWVDRNLGHEWTKRLIPCRDKTLVRGNLLIDDKIDITGLLPPTWEHVLYAQPYNAGIEGKRRIDWNNWREILTEL